jgi:hypothetical protein
MTLRKALAMLAAALSALFFMGLFHALFGPPVSQTELSPPLPVWFRILAFLSGLLGGRLVYWLIMPKKGLRQ